MNLRKARRFPLNVPLRILSLNESDTNLTAETRNIGTGGVCCFVRSYFPAGSRVDYLITLSTGSVPVRLLCSGQVLRCRVLDAATNLFEIVFTMVRYRFARADEEFEQPGPVEQHAGDGGLRSTRLSIRRKNSRRPKSAHTRCSCRRFIRKRLSGHNRV